MTISDFVGTWSMPLTREVNEGTENSTGTVDISLQPDENKIDYSVNPCTDSDWIHSGTGTYNSSTKKITFSGENSIWKFAAKFEIDEDDKLLIVDGTIRPVNEPEGMPHTIGGGPSEAL